MNRRTFVKGTAVTAAAAGIVPNIMAAGAKGANEIINIALIGCGGRGGGAAVNALKADPKTRIAAFADLFPDRLEKTVNQLKKTFKDRADVPAEKQFTGFDGYKKVMALPEIDLVILTTPPHFRPLHIEAAVAAGKHIFAEKPLAVDVAGLKKVMASVEECKKKNLTFLTGFCYRFDKRKLETMKQIENGAIGEIKNVQCSYNTGGLWMHPRQDGWGDQEWQLRNWLYFTWLSGDHIVEQGIHNVDKMGWVTGDIHPEYVYGMGGRQSRVDPAYGHVFDHFSIQYKFPTGVYANFTCRQQKGTDAAVDDIIIGTEGVADLMRHRIYDNKGESVWRFRGGAISMYDAEHVVIMKGLREGEVANNGDYACNSTAMGIMGRISGYTGKKLTWEKFMSLEDNLGPERYDLNMSMDVPEVARPGISKLV